MFLSKSKIYEYRIFTSELKDKKIREIYIENIRNKYWNRGMAWAVDGDHEKLVHFFISKGANEWNRGMYRAAQGGHEKLKNFFKKKLN